METRPYPWKCTRCRQREVYPDMVDYTTTIDHDGRSYTVHSSVPGSSQVPELRQTRPGRCGQPAHQRSLPPGSRVVDAGRDPAGRIRCGLDQQTFADLLGIAVSTLSRWETGASDPAAQPEPADGGILCFAGSSSRSTRTSAAAIMAPLTAVPASIGAGTKCGVNGRSTRPLAEVRPMTPFLRRRWPIIAVLCLLPCGCKPAVAPTPPAVSPPPPPMTSPWTRKSSTPSA